MNKTALFLTTLSVFSLLVTDSPSKPLFLSFTGPSWKLEDITTFEEKGTFVSVADYSNDYFFCKALPCGSSITGYESGETILPEKSGSGIVLSILRSGE